MEPKEGESQAEERVGAEVGQCGWRGQITSRVAFRVIICILRAYWSSYFAFPLPFPWPVGGCLVR